MRGAVKISLNVREEISYRTYSHCPFLLIYYLVMNTLGDLGI